MCLTFKHLFKHLVNKGHSIPVLVYLQDFYNNTRYCYELKCGPGQRGLSGHSQRFPSLECEAYPRDLLVDLCVVQESFYFGLRKAVTSQLSPLVVTLCLSFSEVFIPSFCDVFVWRSLLFNVILAMKLRCGNIRVESALVDWTRCACLCELRGAVPLHEFPYYMFISAAHSLRSPTFPQHIAGVCASSPRGLW